MPIHQEHIEDHIIAGIWTGHVKLDDVFQSVDEAHALAEDHGYETYIQILDARELQNMPFEIRALGKVTSLNMRAMRYLIVGAPVWAKTLTRVISTISRTPMEHFASMDAAIERGRALLKEEGVISS